jgi:hypothetical protein
MVPAKTERESILRHYKVTKILVTLRAFGRSGELTELLGNPIAGTETLTLFAAPQPSFTAPGAGGRAPRSTSGDTAR